MRLLHTSNWHISQLFHEYDRTYEHQQFLNWLLGTILNQNFKLLMGTHDAIQGKFFQRKLQNQHIDVKLWSLIANENGVRAEEIN